MNGNHIKLVAIDMDDTLLRSDNSVSQYTIDILRKVREAGVTVVIATGRMFQAARPMGMKLGLGDVPLIVYTGSMVARCESGKILSYEPMDMKLAKEILALGHEHNWYMQSYIHDELYVPFRDERTDQYERNCHVKAHVLGDRFWTPEYPPLKLLVFERDHEKMKKISELLISRFKNRMGYVFSNPEFFEMNRPNTSKAHALEVLALHWGIDRHEIMTFGDGDNDVPMLSMTPWSFAVANANDHAKKAAHYVTASNNEDGVAKALSKYILEA